MSTRTIRADVGSIRRNSDRSVVRTSPATAPAISTPAANGDAVILQQRYQRVRAFGSRRLGVHLPTRPGRGQVGADCGDGANRDQRG